MDIGDYATAHNIDFGYEYNRPWSLRPLRALCEPLIYAGNCWKCASCSSHAVRCWLGSMMVGG